MDFDDFGDILFFDDVRFLFGISKSTLLKLLHNGTIPAFKIGRQWRFNKEELIHFTHMQNKMRHG